ncbi:TM2 domain-containing protein [bacterium]|nr:TM2 domain-containing protein [bacterium]MBU1676025.1 TM2 domain-containing protein [bacterium]
MFCRNCGKELNENALACPGCGVSPLSEKKFCQACGKETLENQVMCTSCGAMLGRGAAAGAGGKNKVTAGILGILLGSLGVHKFYLGYTGAGIIMLLISLVLGLLTVGIATGVMGTIGLIEGILYLTKSDAEFHAAYIIGKKNWF